MKLKRTRKKILISTFIVAVLGAVGFFSNQFFINDNETNADSTSIEISYDTTDGGVKALGNPEDNLNTILSVPEDDLFTRLKSWSNVNDTRTTENSSIKNFTGGIWKEGRLRGPTTSGYEAGEGPQIMRPVKYLEVPSGSHDWTTNGEVSWTVTSGDYEIKATVLETYSASSHYEPFLIGETHNYFSAQNVYADSCTIWKSDGAYYHDSNTNTDIKCDTEWVITNINQLSADMPAGYYQKYSTDSYGNQAAIFIKLKYTITHAPDTFYLKIDDIDAAQSYRFPNSNVCDNSIPIVNHAGGSCNIYVNPADAAQFSTNTNANDQQNYIYYDNDNVSVFSSYKEGTAESQKEVFANPDKANIYIKFSDEIDEGELGSISNKDVEVTYGFRSTALSRWEFLTEAYNITWNAVDDSNNGVSIANVLGRNGTRINESATDSIYEGETIGIENLPYLYTNEDPESTDENPSAKYTIAHWTVDKDIDGTNITTQTIIPPGLMAGIVDSGDTGVGITDDYTFTAHLVTRSDYTITWKNDDGTTLETDTNVAYGSVPQYNGATPTKPSDGTYTYEFIGWDPAVTTVTGNAVYTAQYKREGIDYVVKFYNEDKTTLVETKTYEYNNKITSVPTATKASTEQYEYVLSDYLPMDANTPELVVGTTAVTSDYNYYAVFTPVIRKYKISFVDDDGTPIDEAEVEYGQTPSHDKAPDKKVDNCAYTFSKWTPEFAVVTGPATYKATYTKECVEDVPNTGLGETLGGANGNNTTIIIAIAGIFTTASAAAAYRFYRRRRIMKF